MNSVKDRSPCIGAMHKAGCDSTVGLVKAILTDDINK